jgi:protocatechuate 3,4-dioxygenase beta subunit
MRHVLAALLLAAAAGTACAAITGIVVNEEGKAVAGASIRAYAPEEGTVTMRRLLSAQPERAPVATAKSDDAGKFSIDLKGSPVVAVIVDAPGRQVADVEAADGDDLGAIVVVPAVARKLRVTAAGKPVAGAQFLSREMPLGRTDAAGIFDWSGSGPQPVWVVHPDFAPQPATGTSSRSLEIKLTPGATIRGRVTGANGPAEHALVNSGYRYAETAADGTFTIAHAGTGRGVLAQSGRQAGTATRATDDKPLEIRLGPGATFSGSVRDSKDLPVAGARLFVSGGNMDMGYTIISDAKGNFSGGPFVPGSYNFGGSHPGYMIEGGQTALSASGTAPRILKATPRPLLRGTVIDEERKPVAGALVWSGFRAPGVNGGRNMMTSAAGEFTVRGTGGERNSYLYAAKRDYAVGAAKPNSDGSPMTIVLPRGFPMRVKVIDRSRGPVAQANLNVWQRDDEGMPRATAVCADPLRNDCFTTSEQGVADFRTTEGMFSIGVGGEGVVSKTVPPQKLTARLSPVTVEVERAVTVSGRVVNSDGAPVAEAMVFFLRSGIAPTATSAADGSFTLGGIAAGRVTLVAGSGKFARIESAPVEVTAPAKNVTLTVPKPARLEGRVVDRGTRQPITEFTISAARPNGPMFPQSMHANDGAFVLEAVAPGELEIRATASGYIAGKRSGVVAEEGKTVSGVEVQLDRGARITGHVTGGGQPLANVQVMRPNSGSSGGQMANTDQNGDYILDGMEAGDRTIEFRRNGFVPAKKDVTVEVGKDARLDVDLDKGRELQGRVADKSGQAVAGAHVTVTVSGGVTTGGAMSAADGTFRLDGLAEGRYFLSARKDGYITATQPAEVPSATQVVLTLDRGGSITGHVHGVEAFDMPTVNVTAFGAGSGTSARPDESGAFSLQGLPDGKVTVVATSSNGARRRTTQKQVDVVNGSGTVELELNEGFTIRGRVMTPGGPLRSGGVYFGPPRGRMPGVSVPTGSSQLQADGSYEVAGLALGAYEVRVDSPGGALTQTAYTVTGNGTFDIELKGSSLRGRIVDATTGAPLGDATVYVQGGGQNRTNRVLQTDSEGRFSADLVPAGQYRVRAQRERYAPGLQQVTVVEGVAADVEVRLETAGTTVIRLFDTTTNAPVDGFVSVIAASSSGTPGDGPSAGTHGEVGETRVYLKTGQYRARASARGYVSQMADFSVPGPEVRIGLMPAGRLVVIAHTAKLVRITSNGTGKPVWGPAPPPMGAIETLAGGSYTLDVLDDKRAVTRTYPFTVVAGQTVAVEIE